MKFLFLLAFVIISVASLPYGQDNNELNPRIIGGNDAKRRQFPYMVSIQINGTLHFCGGAILSRTFVLTAAHCFPTGKDGMFVFAGMLDQKENDSDNQRIPVAEVISHPNWALPYNDVALARLEKPLNYTAAVQPIKLPRSGQNVAGALNLTGWGAIGALPPAPSTRLQLLQMNPISVEECNERFKENGAYGFEIIDTQLCGLPSRHDESGCYGDSGGPLVQNGTIFGVVHAGDTYCGVKLSDPSPTVFSRVSAYIDFIKEHVTDL